jgi:hypothetical protein
MKRKCHLHFSGNISPMHLKHRLNMVLDLQSLFGLHAHSYTHWLRCRNPPPPSHLGSNTRTLLVSQERRHLFVTPDLKIFC